MEINSICRYLILYFKTKKYSLTHGLPYSFFKYQLKYLLNLDYHFIRCIFNKLLKMNIFTVQKIYRNTVYIFNPSKLNLNCNNDFKIVKCKTRLYWN